MRTSSGSLARCLDCAKQEVSPRASKDGFTAIQTTSNEPCTSRRPGKQPPIHCSSPLLYTAGFTSHALRLHPLVHLFLCTSTLFGALIPNLI
jgi:hypothetical protein